MSEASTEPTGERAGVPRLRVGRALEDIWRLYRAHWLLLTVVALVVLVPQSLLTAAVGDLSVERVHTFADVLKLAAIPLTLAVNLGGEAFYSGVVAAIALQWRAGVERPDLRGVASRIPYLTLIAIDLVVALGTVAGLVLLIVPGLAFATYTFASPALVEVRGLGVRAALREGYHLVRGNFWPVASIALTAYVGTSALSELAALPFDAFHLEAAAHLAAEAVAEPFQGAAVVVVALTLLDLHGREPVPIPEEAGAPE